MHKIKELCKDQQKKRPNEIFTWVASEKVTFLAKVFLLGEMEMETILDFSS